MKSKDLLLVIIQFLLLIGYMLVPAGQAMDLMYQIPAFILTLTGILMVAIAIVQLGSSLTPMPTPKQQSSLMIHGIYKYIRHPIYSGIIISALGISIYTMSIPRFIFTVILFIFFQYKSRYEETMLKLKYPDYTGYAGKTGRFFPKII